MPVPSLLGFVWLPPALHSCLCSSVTSSGRRPLMTIIAKLTLQLHYTILYPLVLVYFLYNIYP